MGQAIARPRRLRKFLALAAAGTVVSLLYLVVAKDRRALGSDPGRRVGEAHDSIPHAPPAERLPSQEGHLRAQMEVDRARIEAVERRLSAKETESPKAVGVLEPTPEENLRLHQQQMEAVLTAYRAEPVAAAWARRTEATLQANLEQMAATSKFRLQEVSCRTKGCLAAVEWNSYDLAFSNYGEIVTHGYQLPCGVSMMVPEPADRTAPYRAQAFFSCDTSNE
jgi:hypothetical protein